MHRPRWNQFWEPPAITPAASTAAKLLRGKFTSRKKMTAAHYSLPFDTLVKVENLANSLSVIVKVNDRCRKHEKIFIDVSREAALELGFIRQGKAKVRITVLNTPEKKGAATAKD